ncbi:serine hydrolase domain-containing protein [Streptomyces sp. NPDC090306]|uniref:serine hydrolase domain-containing protein n=1 Tax=Streptomyces sp. NPDC090306 TaxID=3365961 RepID=UPI003819CE0B
MPRHTRRATVLAASLVLALTTGAAAAPALAASQAAPSRPSVAPAGTGIDTTALREALAGLPDADATAALVRVRSGSTSWQGSSGVHDLASGRAADPDARFRAGSTTKVVTAAVVLQLASQGRVRLDAPVRRYLPGLLGPAFRAVTVRQLLDHTSGIQAGDGFGDDFASQYAHRFDTITPRAVVASAVAKGPEFAPGTEQDYLNVNYTVLGLLIEKVTGNSYADEATRRVLRPAGMRDTYFPGTDPRIRGPHNRGYQAVRQADGTTRFVDVTEWNQADRWAAGDMISTTADLERLLTALFRGRIVRGAALEEMFTVPPGIEGATYSAGLQRFEYGGTVYWIKSGSRYGYSVVLGGTRDLSRTLVQSVNATDAKGEGMNPVSERIVMAALAR